MFSLQCWASQCFLRPYVDGLYRKLSRKKQAKMKKKANKRGKMVIHYRGQNGVKKVSET
jgi:hypothetical protein